MLNEAKDANIKRKEKNILSDFSNKSSDSHNLLTSFRGQ